jgi:hypothetical protein
MWRKCILRFARANGWRVPTIQEMLQDRFKPIPLKYADPQKIGLEEMLCPPDRIAQNRENRLERLERERS